MTSLKEWARKAFLEEPPWPDEHFEKVTETYIKELEAELGKTPVPQQDWEGFKLARTVMLKFLKGEAEGTEAQKVIDEMRRAHPKFVRLRSKIEEEREERV